MMMIALAGVLLCAGQQQMCGEYIGWPRGANRNKEKKR